MNRVSSARIAREEGGRAAASPRSRGVILPPRVRARSRGSTGARGGRARSRVPGNTPRTGGSATGNGGRSTVGVECGRYAPQPLPESSLESACGHLEVHAGHDWERGSAASASDVLVMAPALFSTRHAFSPDSRVPRPPGVRLIARGRALRPAGPCPTVRSAVRRARAWRGEHRGAGSC